MEIQKDYFDCFMLCEYCRNYIWNSKQAYHKAPNFNLCDKCTLPENFKKIAFKSFSYSKICYYCNVKTPVYECKLLNVPVCLDCYDTSDLLLFVKRNFTFISGKGKYRCIQRRFSQHFVPYETKIEDVVVPDEFTHLVQSDKSTCLKKYFENLEYCSVNPDELRNFVAISDNKKSFGSIDMSAQLYVNCNNKQVYVISSDNHGRYSIQLAYKDINAYNEYVEKWKEYKDSITEEIDISRYIRIDQAIGINSFPVSTIFLKKIRQPIVHIYHSI